MMMNFLIAILSNSLAAVLKDKEVIITAEKSHVFLSTELYFTLQLPSVAKRYYRWMIPKYFIVENDRVYVSRSILASNQL